MSDDRRLTQAELAARLKMSVKQVQRLTSLGAPFIPTGKRGKVYDPLAVEAWLTAHPDFACQSEKTRPAAGTLISASVASAFTESCRRAQLRLTPSV